MVVGYAGSGHQILLLDLDLLVQTEPALLCCLVNGGHDPKLDHAGRFENVVIRSFEHLKLLIGHQIPVIYAIGSLG